MDCTTRIIQQIIRNRGSGKIKNITVSQAVDYAMQHCFQNKSVARMRDLFREAAAYGYGVLLPDDITEEIARRNLITGTIRGVEHCTSQAVLGEEQRIMRFVRRGKARFMSFAPGYYQVKRGFLSDEQVKAVRDMLTSQNQVIGLQGGAGVGKTTSMQEVVEAIELTGKKVFVFAPIHRARKTLVEDGFTEAATLKKLLTNSKLQKEVKGQVIWVDEAGMIGSPEMLQLFRIAGNNTRILLTGDTKQHSSVDRGEPFRILQKYKVLNCARISGVIRQEKGYYRDAAQALANGDVESAFGYLDAMGAVVEIEKGRERYQALAKEYVACLNAGKVPLLISPTHAEGRQATAAIRKYLHEIGKLGDDHCLTQLRDLQWSDARKERAELYREGYTVQFHQNGKGGIVRGSRFRVQGHDLEGRVLIAGEKGDSRILDVREAGKFRVFQSGEIRLSNGDLIRMTKNDHFPDGRRYYSGQTYQISRIYPSGSIKLKNGALLKKDYGHIQHGYVSTSHASQSVSHDAPVFLVQSAKSFAASSLNQFNVSVTRGKSEFYLYTDDTGKLKDVVRNYQNSLSATEFSDKPTSRVVSQENNDEKSQYYKGIPDKEYDAIFNKKGEFRHAPQFAHHDVGGSFVDYVNFRRGKLTGYADNLQAKQQKPWASHTAEKPKHWSNYKGSKKQNLATAIKTRRGLSVTGASLERRKNILESRQGAKSKPLGEAIADKQKGKQSKPKVQAKTGETSKNKSTVKSTAPTKVPEKNISPPSQAKGKDKGKCKAAAPPAPKPPPPKPPVIVKGK